MSPFEVWLAEGREVDGTSPLPFAPARGRGRGIESPKGDNAQPTIDPTEVSSAIRNRAIDDRLRSLSPVPFLSGHEPSPKGRGDVNPIPPIGGPDYARASLERKFWIATSVPVPGAMALQRELQATIRTPGFDPWQAAETLRKVENAVREGAR